MNKLKEKDGRYYQECEVVMLVTDNKTSVINLENNDELLHINQYVPKLEYGNQHLYFLSNEEIKEGDWFMNRQYMIEEDKEEYAIWRCGDITPNSNPKKIIATTDTSLTIIDYTDCKYPLPQPSKEFIQAFIKAYNEGKPITKVLVEIEGIGRMKSGGEFTPITYQLKVNSSNEITIKKIKDSYTREELPSILQSYLDYCHFSGYITPMKFIKENL